MSQGEIFSATPLDIQTCLNAYGYNQYFLKGAQYLILLIYALQSSNP